MMYRDKIIVTIFAAVSVLLTLDAGAQEARRFDRVAFEAKRNAYITAEVGLTPEEAAEFIPLYDEFRNKKMQIGKEARKLERSLGDQPTDADYKEVLNATVDVRIREAELEKEYLSKFLKVLPAEKVYKYKKAEVRFTRDFMKDNRPHKKGKDKS